MNDLNLWLSIAANAVSLGINIAVLIHIRAYLVQRAKAIIK